MAWAEELRETYRASVRPSLAYGFGGAMIYFTYMGYIDPKIFEGVALTVIGFFYSERSGAKTVKGLQDTIAKLQEEIQTLKRT